MRGGGRHKDKKSANLETMKQVVIHSRSSHEKRRSGDSGEREVRQCIQMLEENEEYRKIDEDSWNGK